MSSQPAPSTISRTLPPLWAERLSIITTCPTFGVGAKTASRQASKTSLVVEPSTAKQGPTHRRVTLASSVTFLPQFLGALPRRLACSCATRRIAQIARRWRPSRPRKAAPLGVDLLGHKGTPGRSQELVALCRCQRSFFGSIPGALASCSRSSRSSEHPRLSPGTRAALRGWPPDVLLGPLPKASLRSRPSWAWSRDASWGEPEPLFIRLGVALDRGSAHGEGAGSLTLGHAPPEGC